MQCLKIVIAKNCVHAQKPRPDTHMQNAHMHPYVCTISHAHTHRHTHARTHTHTQTHTRMHAQVTEAPAVHSRGFHVEFDLRIHKDLGYILPTWKPLPPPPCHDSPPATSTTTSDAALRQGSSDNAGFDLTTSAHAATRIVLPLRAGGGTR